MTTDTSLQQLCWICNSAPADSDEHRIKKSDLVRSYGRGPYAGPNAPVHFSGDVQTNIRGPKSPTLKYKDSLCTVCNNQRTQPWDYAYDTFIDWVMTNEAAVLRHRQIDFADVYGDEFPTGQLSLFKYLVKSFGCRLIDAKRPVPTDMVDLLSKDHFVTALKISFAVNEDLLLMPKSSRDTWLAKGAMHAWQSETHVPGIGYDWHESVSWLTVNYWYGIEPAGSFGHPWIANSRFIYVGHYHSLSPDRRAEFETSVKTWTARSDP